ncbi:MAG: hypothetical protein AAF393_17840 [Pseudomonadota bacterium]
MRLKKRLEELRKKLEKAIRATRDAKVKGILGAGFGALAIVLIPFGGWVPIVGGVLLAGTEAALRQLLKGNEESTTKKTWTVLSTARAVADGLGKAPKDFAPLMVLATGAVDMEEAVSNVKDMAAIKKEIKKLDADLRKTLPKVAKQLKDLDKKTKGVRLAYKKSMSSVRSYRAGKSSGHNLLKML